MIRLLYIGRWTDGNGAPEPPAAVFADDRRRRVAGAGMVLLAALLNLFHAGA